MLMYSCEQQLQRVYCAHSSVLGAHSEYNGGVWLSPFASRAYHQLKAALSRQWNLNIVQSYEYEYVSKQTNS